MNSILYAALLLLLPLTLAAQDDFPLTEESKPQSGAAKGQMLKDTYAASENSVFPGTEREYQIYLPAGLDMSKPAPFMVFQDGVIYQAPIVFDNLIAKQAIPPLIGIFIKPGVVSAANENALPRYNRSFEYDSVTDSYAHFLIDEFLPAIAQKHKLHLSKDPNARGIAGNSSGGICAFIVAWHRPDQFRRVFTGVGTYVGIHGADQLPVLVRKFEPKPLRIFLQSGESDNNLYCGDWWLANQMMERSLTWNGYEVSHAWGKGGHNQKHASQIFPDVLRWLWQGYPDEPVKANPRRDARWRGYEVVGDGGWERVDLAAPAGERWLIVARDGTVARSADQGPMTARHDGLAFTNVKWEPARATQIEVATWTPDQTHLVFAASDQDRLSIAQVNAKGRALHSQPFVLLQPDAKGECQVSGLCVDTNGWLYAATTLGIQVCDQAGRVNFIIPTPAQARDVCFGGKDLSELFIACGPVTYKRQTKAKGCVSYQTAPIKPPPPKL